MPRVKRGFVRRAKRRRLLDRAKGFFQTKSKLYRAAKEAVDKSLKYAYTGRKLRKRDFRKLWITRINAAARDNDITYNRFIQGLNLAGIEVDRKVLADLAVTDAGAFTALVEAARAALVEAGQTTQGSAAA